MKKLLFLVVIGLSACSSDSDLKPVPHDYLVNDGNSKVWMIEQMIVDKSNIASRQLAEQELLIFYQTGRFQYIPLKQLGHKNGRSGSYFLSTTENDLKMYFKEEIWEFKLKEVSEDSIYLVPTKDSDVDFSLHLVPLKEIIF